MRGVKEITLTLKGMYAKLSFVQQRFTFYGFILRFVPTHTPLNKILRFIEGTSGFRLFNRNARLFLGFYANF